LAVTKLGALISAVLMASFLAGQTVADDKTSSRSKEAGDTTSSQSASEEAPVENTNELRLFLVGSIHLYQSLFSSQDMPRCGFRPSCSHFGQEAISGYGFQGLLMTSDRLLRCNGMSTNHYDINPVTGFIDDPVDKYSLWSTKSTHDPAASVATTAGTTTAYGQKQVSRNSIQSPRLKSGQNRANDDLGFADYLFEKGEYERAAAEYQRYLFSSDISAGAPDTIQFQIGICFRRAKNPRAAAPHFENVRARLGPSGLGCAAQRQLVYIRWDEGLYVEAADLLSTSDSTTDGVLQNCIDKTTLGINHLLLKQWGPAYDVFKQLDVHTITQDTSLIGDLRHVAEDGMNLKPKSTTTAAIMSAVIPGSGKVWLGRTWDGVFSLLTIALTTWVAVEGFQDGGTNSVQGWVFGILAAGFYAGNIYGSAVAARNINRATEQRVWTAGSRLAFEFSFQL
jgi:putative component of membrane protein insertase Oxa1/YidC/SpoIIIJ protein YidD